MPTKKLPLKKTPTKKVATKVVSKTAAKTPTKKVSKKEDAGLPLSVAVSYTHLTLPTNREV